MDRKQLSDKLKLRFLEEIRAEKRGNPKEYVDYERCETVIIKSLSSMDLREELLNDIHDQGKRASIIADFDENTIKKYIDSIEDVYALENILGSPNISDEFREQYASKLPEDADSITKMLIWKNADDSIIEKHLEDIPDDEKKYMIPHLKSDELKEKYLKGIEDGFGRSIIIASFESDELKQKYLENIKDESGRVRIITSLKLDDNVKESYLSDIEDESSRAEIIASLKSDELKLSYLPSVESINSKAKIIISLEDDEDKSRLAEELGDIYFETEVMATVKDEEIKKKFLYGKLHPGNFLARELDQYCFQLIESFENYREKNRFASLMGTEYAARIMASITGDEKDFPAETIEQLLSVEEKIDRKEEKSDLENLSIEELKALISSNEAEIKSNSENIERRKLMQIINGQRETIKEQESEIAELQQKNKEKSEVGGGDE